MGKRLRTARDVDGELKLLENTLLRISQSFTLEKDAALEQGNPGICELRDRVRCYYQPGFKEWSTTSGSSATFREGWRVFIPVYSFE